MKPGGPHIPVPIHVICEKAIECDNKSCSHREDHTVIQGCESGCVYLGYQKECSCKITY